MILIISLMAYLEISNFEEYIINWLTTSSRTINLVADSNDKEEFVVIYSISDKRVVREDSTLLANVGRLAKFLCPPLFVQMDLLKEDARCALSVKVTDTLGKLIKFEYELSVCNGSQLDKMIIKKTELFKVSNLIKRISGVVESDSGLYFDVRKSKICQNHKIVSVKKVSFAGLSKIKCIIEY